MRIKKYLDMCGRGLSFTVRIERVKASTCTLKFQGLFCRLEEAVSEGKKTDNVDINLIIANCKNTVYCVQTLLLIEKDSLKLVRTVDT